MPKISDERIQDLERLMARKEELQKKIDEVQAAIQDILDSMTAETRESVSSSSKAAKDRRSKESSNLNHQEVVDAHELTKARLEEDYAEVEKELQELKDLY